MLTGIAVKVGFHVVIDLKMKMELASKSNDDEKLVDNSVDPPEVKVHVYPDRSDGHQVLQFSDDNGDHHEGQDVMILVKADNVVTVSLRLRYGGEDGLDEKHHDEDQGGEIGNTPINGDIETGEQPTLGHSVAQIVEKIISPSTAFSEVL